MGMPDDGPKIKTENIRVRIDTRSRTIMGTVHTPAISYRSRLSDLLNQKESAFLSVTEAAVYSLDNMDEPEYYAPYLAVNLSNIEMVRPMDV